MSDTERISWETCPRCGRRAAVGWDDFRSSVVPIEADCTGGCDLTVNDFEQGFASRSRERGRG